MSGPPQGAKTTQSRDVLLIERAEGDPSRVIAASQRREVIADISLRLIVNGSPLVSLQCLNVACEDLALGFLFTEGFIEGPEQVRRMELVEELYTVEVELDRELDRSLLESTRSMTSGCGRGVSYVDPRMEHLFRPVGHTALLDASALWDRMASFNRSSELYREVGGVHSALFEGPAGRVLAEDIGRHNCVDRIAGRLLRQQAGRLPHGRAPGAGGELLSSGRVSTEILTKCVRLGVEIVVSRSAPTASAIKLASDFGITVIGYARGGKAVLYTGAERLRL